MIVIVEIRKERLEGGEFASYHFENQVYIIPKKTKIITLIK